MDKEWPLMLSFLKEELDYTIRPGSPIFGYKLFYVDLSPWKLRLTDHTPLVWIKKSDLEEHSSHQLLESLQDIVREERLGRQTVLVQVDGDSEVVRKHISNQLHNFVLIGAEEQQKIVHSRRPTGELLDLISSQIPISHLAPYETNAPVVGSRFFGREFERDRILSNPDSNFLVLGIRRIGKTSLLREVKRLLGDKQAGGCVSYIDCSDLLTSADFVREVVRKLNPKELPRLEYQKYVFYFPDFLDRMRSMCKGKIILLLDEIDNLITLQRGDWELLRMLRAAANSGSCQLVIAGFREAMREHNLLDSPFYKFAQEVRLNEFTWKQAHDMIVTPMENLRIRFKNKDEIVGRIYEETAGHPNLIQYYCLILLRRLDQTGEREISPDKLIDVYLDEGFKSHLLTSFLLNTQNREKAIIYALLQKTDEDQLRSFSQAHMDAMLKKQGMVLLQHEMDEACNLLILSGVLHRKGRDYSFTSPVFMKVLQQTYDLKYLIRKVKEEGL
ncbi:MAG: ATP-binding protein [Chloroflexi bacterium]|nr:MAG: ATP-binding protein [Chloroflexota bacterium]